MFMCSRAFPTLCCYSFTVSALSLRSLMHFELILVQAEGLGYSFSLLHVDIQLSLQDLKYLFTKSNTHAL
jgi:hypothetical protein